jgi:hypothetical protein
VFGESISEKLKTKNEESKRKHYFLLWVLEDEFEPSWVWNIFVTKP